MRPIELADKLSVKLKQALNDQNIVYTDVVISENKPNRIIMDITNDDLSSDDDNLPTTFSMDIFKLYDIIDAELYKDNSNTPKEDKINNLIDTGIKDVIIPRYNEYVIHTLKKINAIKELKIGAQDSEYVKNNLIPRLTYEKNIDTNEDAHDWIPGSDVKLQYILMHTIDNDMHLGVTMTLENVSKLTGIAEDMIPDLALRNLNNKIHKNLEIRSLSDYIANMMFDEMRNKLNMSNISKKEKQQIINKIKRDFNSNMVIVRNTDFNSSAILLSTDVLDECARKIGAKIQMTIYPSSVHELIMTKTDTPESRSVAKEAIENKMVESINQENLPPEEVLSDCTYVYNVLLKQLTVKS